MFLMVSLARVIITVIFLFGINLEGHANQRPGLIYSKADLEVLKAGKNYVEFFKHAKDIIPTQRDQSWLEMVSSMAQALVDDYRAKERFANSSFSFIEKLATWPELQNDEFFQVKRNAYALTYFKRCLLRDDKNPCYQEMESFWQTARQDPETGYQLLVLAEGFFPHKNSWKFISKTVSGDFSHFYCQKDLVKHTIEKKLRRYSSLDYQSDHFGQKLEILANKKCWDEVTEFLSGKLLEERAKDQEVLFYALKSINGLSENSKYAFLTKYFLEGPEPGALLNLAWTYLEKLSQDYNSRQAVLKTLSEVDPLPGAIFTDNSKHQIFTRHLVKNFPEYINNYTKTCVSYLSGQKVYPYGNPTLNCHYLFKMDEKKVLGEKIISQPLRIRYSGLMKNSIE